MKGGMQCKTIFSSKSWSGLKLDILKSGVQKYGRRREFNKMVRCVMEMNLFKLFGKKGQGIRSNMINRIKVMCFEELCFCKPRDFLKIMHLISKWEKDERQDDNHLIDICNIFVHSELLRLPSDIKYYYRNVYPKTITKPLTLALPGLADKYKKDDDNEEVLFHLSHFICDIANENDEAYYRAFMIMNMAAKGVKGARRWRRKDCDYIIWDVLFDRGGEKLKECLRFALNEYFKKNRFLKGDRLVVIITAILWVMHKDQLDWTASKVPVLSEVDRNALVEWTAPFVPDPFIIDKHCSAGRAAGKNIIDFAKEGSVVVRENKRWLNKKYRDAYIGGKIKVHSRKKKGKEDPLEQALESIDFEEFNNITPCMQRTCGNKAMCFFAEYKGKRICLKEGRKSMKYNRDYIVVDSLKHWFGLRDLNMRRIKMDKVGRKKDKATDTWDDNTEWVNAPGTVYAMMDRIEGATRLSWKKDMINMKELVKIGLFRGIFRVTDFNLCNVLTNEAGEHWSVDEHQIGVRKKILGKKCGWVKNITREMVDEALVDLMENSEMKLIKIKEKLKHYKFDANIISRCERNYTHLKTDVYNEMGYYSKEPVK